MGIEENKAVVREYIQRMNQGDFSVIDELFASNFAINIPGTDMSGDRDGFKQYAENESFTDSSRTIDDMVAEGDKVSVRETIIGKHTRTFRGVKATGKDIKVTRCMIFRLEENKIAEIWNMSDMLTIFQQLGALPPTEEIGK